MSISPHITQRLAARSTVLSAEEEALVAAFRKHSLLPLDDCLNALQATIPHLTRPANTGCSSAMTSAGCLSRLEQKANRRAASAWLPVLIL